jgi:hypothetical protein
MGQTYPLPITNAMLAPANENAAKPRLLPADYVGGAFGDDIDTASAAVAVAQASGAAPTADYGPRTQADKAAQLGTTLAEDVTRPRGSIGPRDPYPVASDPAPAAPVVTTLTPDTAPTTSLPLTVTITGTGFTVWSTVYTGGMPTPEAEAVYVSPTQMRVPIWAAQPGTVSVAVKDHDTLSNADVVFTVT